MRSLLTQAEGQAGEPALEAIKLAIQRRTGGAEYVVWILAIRYVERINPDANLPLLAFGAFLERNVDCKVAIHLYVERKISREAETVGNAHIVLEIIQVRIRKAGVHIGYRAEDKTPKGNVHKTPDQ